MNYHPAQERGLAIYRTMRRIRDFETLALDAHHAGELPGFLHVSIGQEAAAAVVCSHLERSDRLTSTHRGHGHALAKGADVGAMMAELYGRASGFCQGKGGSMHIADFSVGMLGANGVVAGGIGIACGAAQGLEILGLGGIVACFFGDGAVNRGPFLEGLNWAALYRLPVLFVCEDNTFSAFTYSSTTTAGPGPLARAESLGVRGISMPDQDVSALDRAAHILVERIRQGEGPQFLHVRTYRFAGHTSTDPAAYRSAQELAAAKARDPLAFLCAELLAGGYTATELDAINAASLAEMTAARDRARLEPWPQAELAFADVQDDGAPQWQ